MALGPAAEPRANYRPPRPGNGSAAVLRPDMVATSPVIGGVANVVMEIVIVTAISIVVVAVVAPMTVARCRKRVSRTPAHRHRCFCPIVVTRGR